MELKHISFLFVQLWISISQVIVISLFPIIHKTITIRKSKHKSHHQYGEILAMQGGYLFSRTKLHVGWKDGLGLSMGGYMLRGSWLRTVSALNVIRKF